MVKLPAVRLAAVMSILLFGLEAGALAQDDGGWVGRRVMTRLGTVLKVDVPDVDDAGQNTDLAVAGQKPSEFRVYRVERVKGPWLLLEAEREGAAGWAKVECVIPFDQALDTITSAIRARPSSVLYSARAELWRERKEYDIAIADCNEAIRLDPRSEVAHAVRGNVWRAKKEYDRAIADFDEAIRLDPRYTAAYATRGNVWRARKEYDRAIADYGAAIRLDPRSAKLYNNRGNAWLDKQQYDRAIADYSEAIRLDPGFAMAYINRGKAWGNKKEYDRAIADYGEAIRLDPGFAMVYNNRGFAWSDKKQYYRAIADYGEAIRLDPGLAIAYTNRGWVAYKTGDYDCAIADLNEAICLDPQSTQVYWTRGVTWEKMGHYDRALADFDEAVRIDPNDPHGYSCRAGLLATCPAPKYRDGKRAFEDASRAKQLSGGMNAVVFDVLAAACAELGDFDSAVKWQQKALDLLGKDDEVTRKDYNACLELYRDKKPSRIAPVE